MSTEITYALPVDQTSWTVDGEVETVLRWEYDDGRDSLLNLYEKGKQQQWNAAERIDWSQDLDPENPMELPDEAITIYGSDVWRRLTSREKANLRRHLQAWQISQFLHGEQGALVCTAKIVQSVPNLDAKFYAATQVVDEARHVEAYSRLLHEKFELAYPITPALKALLEDTLRDRRWDFTYLGMQVLIEGLALAAFQRLRDQAKNPLAAAINAYVMQDEARHVAFGRLALRDFYRELTEPERAEREAFVVDACYLMRDRFLSEEVWETVGLSKKECMDYVDSSPSMQAFRTRLFGRIVPTVKDIGLWGPKVRRAFEDMGVLGLANIDTEALLEQDRRLAEEFEAMQGALSGEARERAPIGGRSDTTASTRIGETAMSEKLQCARHPNQVQALGMAVNLLRNVEPFSAYAFGPFVSNLMGQIRRRHYVFTLQGKRVVGYAGWALCDPEIAEAWLERRRMPSYEECVDGECWIGLTFYAATREVCFFQARHIRNLYPGCKVVFRRDYGERRRGVRVVNLAAQESGAESRP